ncbi:MAG: efflux RND transporter periplasmic adaptor subunit, partial [Puniceicoccales bacterium]
AQVNQRKAQVSQAEAQMSLADANKLRAERLIESDAISEEELDIRRSQQLQAQADLEAAKASLEAAELDLSFTRVTAPIEGIADRYFVTEGNLVTGENQSATLLTTIVPHNPIYAVFEVDERSFLKNLRSYFNGNYPGRSETGAIPAYLGLDGEEGYPREGSINFASNRLDPGTATLTVRAIFDNDDGFMTPGLFARIRVPQSKEKDGILIPQEAVGASQSIRYVWVVKDDNTVAQRQIKLGPVIDGMRLVNEGLEGDETIIISGIQFVQPGAPVNPQPAPKKATEAEGDAR